MMVTVAAAAALIIQEIQKIKMWGEEKKQTSQTAGPYFNQMIEDSKMYWEGEYGWFWNCHPHKSVASFAKFYSPK